MLCPLQLDWTGSQRKLAFYMNQVYILVVDSIRTLIFCSLLVIILHYLLMLMCCFNLHEYPDCVKLCQFITLILKFSKNFVIYLLYFFVVLKIGLFILLDLPQKTKIRSVCKSTKWSVLTILFFMTKECYHGV